MTKEPDFEKIEEASVVEKVEKTKFSDIFVVHCDFHACNTFNILKFAENYEVSYVDFDERKIEFTRR